MLDELLAHVRPLLPTLATLVVVGLFLAAVRLGFALREGKDPQRTRLPRQLTMLVLTGLALVVVVINLPVDDATQHDLLSLLGLAVSALLTLSSTTFVSNAMAGAMLRSTHDFRPGDFVRVGEAFGRVTERGLFHVKIQTEDRDLQSIPNLQLVTKPVTTILASGTMVSASVSLGYDADRREVEGHLLEAAAEAELADPFVYVMELGDHAVVYRVAGFLEEVAQLLTVRSSLRKRILDGLHAAGIEIASPTLMNQRPFPADHAFMPAPRPAHAVEPEPAVAPEEVVFDKAVAARAREDMAIEKETLERDLIELEKVIAGATEEERATLVHRRDALVRRRDELEAALAEAEDEASDA